MKLIVGLGNPGNKYENTRHNAGFLAVEAFIGQLDGVEFKEEKKFNSHVAKYKQGDEDIFLVKPQTFMNDSGKAVGAIAQFYKIQPENILIVYDELDIPFGTIRTRRGGSTAGHNGVESIVQSIGSDFWRIRIGIQNEQKATWDTSDFVLAPFSPDEQSALPGILDTAVDYIEEFTNTGKLPVETSKG